MPPGHGYIEDADRAGGADLVEQDLVGPGGDEKIADKGGTHTCAGEVPGGDQLGYLEADIRCHAGLLEETAAPAVEIVAGSQKDEGSVGKFCH